MSLLEDLIWLVDTPSVTGEEHALAAAVAGRLGDHHPVALTGPALVVGTPDDRPQITLYGHLDTVPDQENGKAEIRDDRLHGLGSSDMKAGLAVMIALLEDPAVRSGPFNVTGVFYDREEGPAHENGLETLLDEFDWLTDAEFAIVMEPTDLQLEVGCQGALNATLTFLGKSAHSARPWLGENAVTKAGAWLATMHERAPQVVVVEGYEFRELFSVTLASGGLARNVIPPTFDINLNYRFPPSLDLDEAEARLREVAAAADEITIVDRAPAAPIPCGEPPLRALEDRERCPIDRQAGVDRRRPPHPARSLGGQLRPRGDRPGPPGGGVGGDRQPRGGVLGDAPVPDGRVDASAASRFRGLGTIPAMPVDIDIAKVARLARIRLTDEELAQYGEQLGDILEHAARVQALATDDVAPTAHPLPMVNAFRADEIEPSLDREEVLAEAPDRDGPYFKVPAFLEDS